MASVAVLIFIITSVHTFGLKFNDQIVHVGSNHTLRGPIGNSEVTWYWYYADDSWPEKLCDDINLHNILTKTLNSKTIKYNCTDYDLILVNVTTNYSGFYYGTNFENVAYYNILVKFRPTTTKTSSSSTITSTTLPIRTAMFQLNKIENTTNSNYTLFNDQNVQGSLTTIIILLIVGLIIIIICMIVYTCRYRKLHNKVDPY